MAETLIEMLEDYRKAKIPLSYLEKTLGFSNGLLGKAAKCKTKLSAAKFAALKTHHDNFFLFGNNNSEKDSVIALEEEKDEEGGMSSDMKELKAYLDKNKISPIEMILFHKKHMEKKKEMEGKSYSEQMRLKKLGF